MRRQPAIALGFAIGLASLPPATEGQVFRCKDADGRVTYTDVPCLRSEISSIVDTRSNVADHSSIRSESTRLQTEVTAAPQPHASAPAPAPSPPPPAPTSERRRSGYSR